MLKLNDDYIIEGVLAEFSQLAKIPRMSGHEKAVSDYLFTTFREMGCLTVQDQVNNIIATLPATPGHEMDASIAFQAHMDMVCVAEPGREYDPLNDPITLVYDDKYGKPGEYLRADGTTLGADDGIGVAEAIFIMKEFIRQGESHGQLKAIITVDEETCMTGAINLDAKHLSDVKYMFNCDSENYDELTVGSAGSINIDFVSPVRWTPMLVTDSNKGALSSMRAMGYTLYKLSISGLKGGHSGMEIGAGRGNVIRALARSLVALQKADIPYRLVRICGGKARNAIPAEAEAIIFVGASPNHSPSSEATSAGANDQQALIEKLVAHERELFLRTFGKNEVPERVSFSIQEITAEEAKNGGKRLMLMDKDTGYNLPRLILQLLNGVAAMSRLKDGLVETSANIGRLDTTGDEVRLLYFPRSSVDAKLLDFAEKAKDIADDFGFRAVIGNQAPGWAENPDSHLSAVMQEVFAEQNGFPMKVETIHAGLECGYHFKKNPKLDIVSIGVSTFDIHSPQERLLIWTIASQVQLMAGTISRL